MPNFNSIGSGVSEPQVAKIRYPPLTRGIAFATMYEITCYTVITLEIRKQTGKSSRIQTLRRLCTDEGFYERVCGLCV